MIRSGFPGSESCCDLVEFALHGRAVTSGGQYAIKTDTDLERP